MVYQDSLQKAFYWKGITFAVCTHCSKSIRRVWNETSAFFQHPRTEFLNSLSWFHWADFFCTLPLDSWHKHTVLCTNEDSNSQDKKGKDSRYSETVKYTGSPLISGNPGPWLIRVEKEHLGQHCESQAYVLGVPRSPAKLVDGEFQSLNKFTTRQLGTFCSICWRVCRSCIGLISHYRNYKEGVEACHPRSWSTDPEKEDEWDLVLAVTRSAEFWMSFKFAVSTMETGQKSVRMDKFGGIRSTN